MVPQRRLPHVTLGTGPSVSAIGFGAMPLSSVYGAVTDEQAEATLAHAIDAGITLIDTADAYGGGHNERLVGRVTRGNDDVTIATKFGVVGNPATGDVEIRGDAEYVKAAAEASLERLDRESIDLLYAHRLDHRVPVEETVGAMAGLVAEGKVGAIGLSEITADELRRAHAVHPVSAVQSEWSLFSRDIEAEVIPAARELGVAIVAFSPLGRGVLAGAAPHRSSMADDDFRRRLPRFADDAAEANARLARRVADVAARHEATPAQVALAWLAARAHELEVTVVPIPGTRNAQRIDENLGALRIELRADDLRELDALADEVVGPRGWGNSSGDRGHQRRR